MKKAIYKILFALAILPFFSYPVLSATEGWQQWLAATTETEWRGVPFIYEGAQDEASTAEEAFVCGVTIDRVSVTDCYFFDGLSYATVSVELSWMDPPGPAFDRRLAAPRMDKIVVDFGGGNTRDVFLEAPFVQTNRNIQGYKQLSSPQVVSEEFLLGAAPVNGTIMAAFTLDGTCSATASYTLPAECPENPCTVGTGVIGGQVFEDTNFDGVQAAGETNGFAGVDVFIFGDDGMGGTVLVDMTTTDLNGDYFFTGLSDGEQYRIEFDLPGGLADAFRPTLGGPSGYTLVQFATSPSCDVLFGLNNPNVNCQAEPDILIPCYVRGATTGPIAANGTLVQIPYLASGDAGLQNTYYATHAQTGAIWGQAYDANRNLQYSSAVLRRHSDFGPLGIGGLYVTDLSQPASNTPTTGFIDLDNVDGLGYDFGTVAPRIGLPTDVGTASYDPTAFEPAGTVGIGDIEYDPGSDRLFVMNLATNTIYVIDLSGYDPTDPTTIPGTGEISTIPGPNPGCGTGVARPWATKIKDGNLFVGTVCDASVSGEVSDLRAYVYEYDLATSPTAPPVSLVFDFPLTYPKGAPSVNTNANVNQLGNWQTWSNNYVATPSNQVGTTDVYIYPQPLLSDIEFDTDGSMILGFLDRTSSLQMGYQDRRPDDVNNTLDTELSFGAGDILRAFNGGSAFVLENEAKAGPVIGSSPGNFQGPGFGEFYNENFFARNGNLLHAETGLGGLGVVPGSGQVAAGVVDAVQGVVGAAGVRIYDNSTGNFVNAYNLYANSANPNSPAFGKSGGLGDIEFLCSQITTIEIGNYVWRDVNGDGVMGPDEPPLAGLFISLYDPVTGDLIGTTTTDANGNYFFNNLDFPLMRPETDYQLVFGYNGDTGESQFDPVTGEMTVGNFTFTVDPDGSMGQPPNAELNDSDAEITSVPGQPYDMFPVVSLTSPRPGDSDNSYSFGALPEPCELTIVSVTPNCNYNAATDSSEFSVDVTVSWINPPAGEDLVLSVNGNQLATATPDMSGMTTFTGVAIDESPGYGYTLQVNFATTTECVVLGSLDLLACTPSCTTAVDAVGGTVFQDANNDGAGVGVENGQENVLVQVFDCDGNVVCEVYTNADGGWTCDGLNPGENYRVEFATPLQPYLDPSFAGTDNGTDVQFVQPGTCEVDYGVVDPDQFCQANPLVVVACYVSNNNNSAQDVLVAFDYDDESMISGSGVTGPDSKRTTSFANQVASAWGMAYDRTERLVYSSAVLKRHAGLTDAGLDAIFTNDPFSATPNGSLWLELGDLNIDVGQNDIGDNAARDLSGSRFSYDVDAYSLVGTIGIGDIDFSADMSTLYATNIKEGTLLEIDVASMTLRNTYPVPDPGCQGGDFRIWAVDVHEGRVYVGGVCDALTSQNPADLQATVFELSGNSFNTVLSFPMDYAREEVASIACPGLSGWQAWTNAEPTPCDFTSGGAGIIVYPQPLFTDIEFDSGNNMILGFSDRSGFQWGAANFRPDPAMTDTDQFSVFAGGDILRACLTTAGGWEIESANGSCTNSSGGAIGGGPGMREFYNGEFFDSNSSGDTSHAEIAIGSLAYLPGTDEVMTTVYDPVTGGPFFGRGGVIKLSNTTGEKIGVGTELYASGGDFPNFSKGVGLGDIVLACDPLPLQVGNYAWQDANGDGIQQACEPPLSMIQVALYDDEGNLIATTVTDANGNYFFDSESSDDPNLVWVGTGADTALQNNVNYNVVFGTDGMGNDSFDPVTGVLTSADGSFYQITEPNVGEGVRADQNDSDLVPGTVPTREGFPTLSFNSSDGTIQQLDAGFAPFILCPFIDLIAEGGTICGTDSIELAVLVDSLVTESFVWEWTTSGTGVFNGDDADGNPSTGDYATATFYTPSELDRRSGEVTLTLTSVSGFDANCPDASDSTTVVILKVDCGSFPWGGE